MNNQSRQPYAPYPQQQAYPPYPIPYQVVPKKKSQALSIASFIITAIAYIPIILLIISAYTADYDASTGDGLGMLTAMLSVFYVPPLILISTILAIIGLAVNKTKSALIALLVAGIPTALFYTWFFYL